LKPYTDEHTIRVHHGKHHAAYLKNLMTALEKHPEMLENKLEDPLRNFCCVVCGLPLRCYSAG
jgi:Fe-Mn family superoxide dismutase